MKMIDVNQFLYSNFITYDRLFAMNKKAFYGKSDATAVNIFVDIRSYTKSLFRTTIKYSYKDHITPVASSLINLAIHLKQYYMSRHMVRAKVYLVWGRGEVPCSKIKIMGYNAHETMKYYSNAPMRELIEKNIESLKIVCPYLDGVYLVDCGKYESAYAIQSMINDPERSKIYKGVPNIIYSRDPLHFQLVACNSYTFIFAPRKTRGDMIDQSSTDASRLVEKANIYSEYRYANGYYAPRDTREYDQRIDLFIPISVFAHMKYKHVDNLTNFTKAGDILYSYAKDFYPCRVSYESFKDWIINDIESGKIKLQKRDYFNRYMDVVASAMDMRIGILEYMNTPEFVESMTGIVDLYNPEDLKRINDKYFVNYPIDLMRMC